MRWLPVYVVVLSGGGLLYAGPGKAVVLPDRAGPEATEYAQRIHAVINEVTERYVREIPSQDLYLAALEGLYEAAQRPVPATLAADVQQARSRGEIPGFLGRVRESLRDAEALRGHQALVASCRSVCRLLDPYSAVVTGEDLRRAYGVDQQHGVGLELAENAGTGPLLVKAVFPGGPAQKAGLRPGDEILGVDKQPVKGQTALQVQQHFLGRLLDGTSLVPPDLAENVHPGVVRLTVRRDGAEKPWDVVLERQTFQPETVLGYTRRDDNSWDYWIDRRQKIALVRVAALGNDTRGALAGAVARLRADGLRGLVLDLRWCPGGYVSEAVGVADLFVAKGPIATFRGRKGEEDIDRMLKEGPLKSPDAKFLDVPLVVLVNGETSGGAELIAAALQDHRRAAVVGQRTRGKASMQSYVDIGVPAMGMKITTGTFYRPSGKNLHRHPDSRPGADWGVRPEAGAECRVSPGLDRELRDEWQRQTLRPGGSRERLPLDDPAADPPLQAALRALGGE
jgi:carboxyl-terminal processing protease